MWKRLGLVALAVVMVGVGIASAQGVFPWSKVRSILKSEFSLQGSNVERTHIELSEAVDPVPVSVVGKLVIRKKTGGGLEASWDGAPFQAIGGGSGHIVEDALGEFMPARSTLHLFTQDCTDNPGADATDCNFTTPRPFVRSINTIYPEDSTVRCVRLSGTTAGQGEGCVCYDRLSGGVFAWEDTCDGVDDMTFNPTLGTFVIRSSIIKQFDNVSALTVEAGTGGFGPSITFNGEAMPPATAGDVLLSYGGDTSASNGAVNGTFTLCRRNSSTHACDNILTCDVAGGCSFSGAVSLGGDLSMGGFDILNAGSVQSTCDPTIAKDCGVGTIDNTGPTPDSEIPVAGTHYATRGGNAYITPKGGAEKKLLDVSDKLGAGGNVASIVGPIPDGHVAMGGGGDGRLVDGGPAGGSTRLGTWTWTHSAASQSALIPTAGGSTFPASAGFVRALRCRQYRDDRTDGVANCASGTCYTVKPIKDAVVRGSGDWCGWGQTSPFECTKRYAGGFPIAATTRLDMQLQTGALTDTTTYNVTCDAWGDVAAVTTTTVTTTTSTTTTTLSGATNYTNDANVMGCYFFDDSLDIGKDSCGGTGSGDDPFTLAGTTVPTYDSTNKQQGTGSVAMGTGGGYLNCTGSSVCPNINAHGDAAITVVGWSKLPATSGWRSMMTQGKDGSSQSYRAFSVQNGSTPSFAVNNVSNVDAEELAATSSTTTWTHLCSIYDGANITTVVNGVSDCSTPGCDAQTGTIGTSTAGTDVHIGATITGAGSPKDFHKGNIDELAIFNRALTAAECCEICRMGLDGQTSDRGAACGTCTLP